MIVFKRSFVLQDYSLMYDDSYYNLNWNEESYCPAACCCVCSIWGSLWGGKGGCWKQCGWDQPLNRGYLGCFKLELRGR